MAIDIVVRDMAVDIVSSDETARKTLWVRSYRHSHTGSHAALQSQACLSEASTKVGDHLGSSRDELFFFPRLFYFSTL